MRGLLNRAWSVDPDHTVGGGGWIVAKGFSGAYPCYMYDCQTSHWFEEDPTKYPSFARVTDVKTSKFKTRLTAPDTCGESIKQMSWDVGRSNNII
jgi:hypothetical protein